MAFRARRRPSWPTFSTHPLRWQDELALCQRISTANFTGFSFCAFSDLGPVCRWLIYVGTPLPTQRFVSLDRLGVVVILDDPVVDTSKRARRLAIVGIGIIDMALNPVAMVV